MAHYNSCITSKVIWKLKILIQKWLKSVFRVVLFERESLLLTFTFFCKKKQQKNLLSLKKKVKTRKVSSFFFFLLVAPSTKECWESLL